MLRLAEALGLTFLGIAVIMAANEHPWRTLITATIGGALYGIALVEAIAPA